MINTAHKTALVTGANKGIGREIAHRLCTLGYTVWLGCRDSARGEAAALALREQGLDARLLRLDVSSDESVSDAAIRLAWESERLDALVNNAGIVLGRERPSEARAADVKSVYDVNVFGPIRTTQAFLPLLRRSDAPRVVMISSGLGSLSAASDPASRYYSAYNNLGYNTSKTALNAVTVSLAKDLAADGIKVNAADPGYTATDLNGHTGPRTAAQAAEIAVKLATLGPDGPTGGYFNENGPLTW
jgi:NAD(P)-dependent dehydrogenase (short-subunit alcohol dehydrogenase family)